MTRFIIAVAAAPTLAACAVEGQLPPENNDAFYAQAQGHRYGRAETFVVPRKLSSVAASLETGADKCLNRRVTQEFFSTRSYSKSESNYRGEVVRSGQSVTLNLRRRGTTAVIGGTNAEYRQYMAEARSVSGGTQIRMAGPSTNFGDVFKAVSEWSRGQGSRCPAFKL